VVQPVAAYLGSVHARAVAAGEAGATCSSCHGSHAIFPAADPRSSVHHRRVASTCGACHGEIASTFAGSVHGQALARGVREAPACTDCHGEHKILAPSEPGSPVFPTNVPKQTCGRCHGDLRLAAKFGLDPGKVPSFEDSYHGLALRTGGVSVAHCGSCHGVHDILPSADPRSRVHRDHLAATCGQCHPGAGTRFALGPVHVVATAPEHGPVYWVRRFYLTLIWVTVGLMLLHNGLDLYRKAASPAAWAPRAPAGAGPVRMPLGFRLAHGALAASFVVLVYTGFALKYPEGWWAQPLLAWEESFGLRGLLHRGAAVVLLAAGVFHLVHLARDRRARACALELARPRLADLREFRERLRWFFGRREAPPRSPWVGYAEKAEYLALLWGTALMAATGFLLWFENLALAWAPKWATDVATAIHFYEGVLATLAILVWHLYFVVFDPVVYPMDPAWRTGRSAPGRVHERRGPEG
jgi:cytochrome b subunit of formate dehydrogenase